MVKQDILKKQAKNLLDEIKKTGKDFTQKTSKIVSDVDKTAKELDKIDLNKELGKIEKSAVQEMDAAVLDFLSEE